MVTALARELHALDTEVVDVEEPPFRPTPFEHEVALEAVPPIARPRVDTKDLTVHVRLDDGWHRVYSDGSETSCGRPYSWRMQLETRNERKIEHPLAENCDCWTQAERRRAGEAYRKEWGRDYVPWSRGGKTP